MHSSELKALLRPLRAALYDYDVHQLQRAVTEVFDPNALIQLAHPFETMAGPDDLTERGWQALGASMPDLERRDTIVLSGQTNDQAHWVGCCGYYTGTFRQAWLDIPPTGQQAAMRFHEFYRFEGERVVEFQALWDIPELMMQAGVWPMAPSLGREWQVPGPASQDGLHISAKQASSEASYQLVERMLQSLGNYATGGVAAMRLEDYWHPHFSWYGPAGIGTSRGVSGFRAWHQAPFLSGMPDRVGDPANGHFFCRG